jgi:beta-glucanase (GH16 family)
LKYNSLNYKFSVHITALFLMLISISSCGGSSDNDEIDNNLSNLVIEANITGADELNPFGDGSGTVTFNFSANNATLYKVNLGNSEIIETSSNTITYTYTGAGTNTYNVLISAYNADKFITTSLTIKVKINSGLVWSDEFNYTGSPDESKWGYNIGRGDNGWGNGESQYYTKRSNNVIVEDGVLKITARKENYEGAEYTSTRMLTEGKFDFTYGRVEVRAKLPIGEGTWPAIWMLGSNIRTVGWPACGEIDIMENWGHNHGTISSALHTPSSYGNTVNHGSQYLADVSSKFHVYGLEWTPNEMIFTVDDVEHYRYKPTTKDSSTWPFDAKQFIILNVAMGGSWFSIDPNFTESTMEVDYVRVYQ